MAIRDFFGGDEDEGRLSGREGWGEVRRFGVVIIFSRGDEGEEGGAGEGGGGGADGEGGVEVRGVLGGGGEGVCGCESI